MLTKLNDLRLRLLNSALSYYCDNVDDDALLIEQMESMRIKLLANKELTETEEELFDTVIGSIIY